MFGCNHRFNYAKITGDATDGINRHHTFGRVECSKCEKTFTIQVHAVPSTRHNKLMEAKDKEIAELKSKLKSATEVNL